MPTSASSRPARDTAGSPAGKFGNRFLDALPLADAQRLIDHSTEVHLPLRQIIYQRGERPRFGYFLTTGLSSEVYTSKQGNTIELSMVGREGLVGWACLLGKLDCGADVSIQMEGTGYRISMDALQREFDDSAAVRRCILEFVQHKALTAHQLVACNRLHRAGARFARWLLMVAERSCTHELPLTQEFLGYMLGTRRTTVAEEAGALQRTGAIEYSRGVLRIVDEKKLAAHACECFDVVHCLMEQLYKKEQPHEK